MYTLDAIYRECRAYGRLQEMGVTHVAARCHGYMILTPDPQEHLRSLGVPVQYSEPGKTRPPLKAIVKELIDSKVPFTSRMAPRMIRNLHTIHEVGICVGDIHHGQYLGGQLLDFGHSTTV